MSYFPITFINNNKCNKEMFDVCCSNDDKISVNPFLSKTTFKYVKQMKQEIDKYQTEWDNLKKYVNPYEYIHTQIPDCKSSVSKIKPISRSYYKLIEICDHLNVLNDSSYPISSFHLAEGPGGFIEAIISLRKNPKDSYYGMTLIGDDANIPGWNKNSQLKRQSNVNLIKGCTNDGDLLKKENLQYCFEHYKSSMDIITGDGGFDFSMDFNKQELVSAKLILAQIFYAIILQKAGGTFIIKFFDIFYKSTCDMIFLLSCFYDKIYIIKPNTSRFANSEKYIVCKFFKYNINKHELLPVFKKIINDIQDTNYITNILNFKLPSIFTSKIEEINSVLGQQQIECIINTLQLIENQNNSEKLEQLKQNNIQKCINWCIKYRIPHHKIIQQTNIFLEQEN
tara:strand:- start:6295 stop:7482 length:1188 start_codon:yes stop_codon:yes gene_type:complete